MRSDGLDDEQIDEILTNLNAPVLSDLEKVLVPFARETVRFPDYAGSSRSMAATPSAWSWSTATPDPKQLAP